jgi:hypothetical protein
MNRIGWRDWLVLAAYIGIFVVAWLLEELRLELLGD